MVKVQRVALFDSSVILEWSGDHRAFIHPVLELLEPIVDIQF
jgi:hypothetical protein